MGKPVVRKKLKKVKGTIVVYLDYSFDSYNSIKKNRNAEKQIMAEIKATIFDGASYIAIYMDPNCYLDPHIDNGSYAHTRVKASKAYPRP